MADVADILDGQGTTWTSCTLSAASAGEQLEIVRQRVELVELDAIGLGRLGNLPAGPRAPPGRRPPARDGRRAPAPLPARRCRRPRRDAGWWRPAPAGRPSGAVATPRRPSQSLVAIEELRGTERLLLRASPVVTGDGEPPGRPGVRDVGQAPFLHQGVLAVGLVVAPCAPPRSTPRGPAGCRRRRATGRERLGARDPSVAPAPEGKIVRRDQRDEHRVPLQALGAVDGQQLDRVGLGRASRPPCRRRRTSSASR